MNWAGKRPLSIRCPEPSIPELEQMVGEYYDEQGWDPETGVPTQRRLEELGL